ncbi:MFS transporter [Streptomyces pseudovenezuelae]|uniref:SET family sugar efflux transporter-like MFS transporter n=1 Tax=Streptomyces pseudovenezuelae TaxID=67350 RepID=A0ABT6L9T9_9ACTN|nr:MFS transporter [Streptomyces pseudovenezuelae]MDH6213081.1 SET family sugar efflux transporter-like MFS transporter [Streptomyces pseudovenezuelae]
MSQHDDIGRQSGSVEDVVPGVVAAEQAAQDSALRLVLASPLYRGATIALFLAGLGQSAAAPQIALFLTRELGGSLTTAGLFYLTNLTAPVAGYLVGARSDRTGGRLGLFRVCAVAGFLGWAGIACATQLWMPFVISAVVLGFAGGAASQIFAAIHDELSVRPSPVGDGVVSVVRMALTAGWIVGPSAGAVLAARFGLRPMLFATALLALAQLVPLGMLRTPSKPAPAGPSPKKVRPAAPLRTKMRTMRPLLLFTALYVFVYAGEPVKYAYLPIYMIERLHFPSGVEGAIIGIQPLVELVLMPFAVLAARRIGMMRLMVVAAGFGVAANICFATTASAPGLFAGQILMGGVWGVFAALGIIMAQRLLPGAVATASAIFMSSTALSSALGGSVGGLGVAALGLPHVFLIPAGFALLAVIGLSLMDRSTRRSQTSSSGPPADPDRV